MCVFAGLCFAKLTEHWQDAGPVVQRSAGAIDSYRLLIALAVAGSALVAVAGMLLIPSLVAAIRRDGMGLVRDVLGAPIAWGVVLVAATAIVIAAFLLADPYWSIMMIATFVFFIACYTSLPLVAAITSFPGRLRGKASSFIILVCSTGGIALGPLTVGWLTDVVFRDSDKLGHALLCAILIFTFFVAAPFAFALGPLRAFRRADAAIAG